jgi:hypothetical protein
LSASFQLDRQQRVESGRRYLPQLAALPRARDWLRFASRHLTQQDLTKEALKQSLAAGRPAIILPE